MAGEFVPANQREENVRLSELSNEAIAEIAKRYTRQDWHIVRDFAEELGIEVTEKQGLQALFNCKYKALVAKARSKAQEDVLDTLTLPDA